MFTGIIRFIGTITNISKKKEILQYAVDFPHEYLEIGASVSVEGICQTVVKIEEDQVWFEAIPETLKRTTLNTLKIGQNVNIERSAKWGDEIGGHLLSGHIYGTALLVKIEGNAFTFSCNKEWHKYLFSKGYIAINGISLTLVDVTDEGFTIHLIPETLKRTTLSQKKIGNKVNIEFDSMTLTTVETVERILSNYF